MASLDNLEGDLVETATLAALVILVIVGWALYQASKGVDSALSGLAKKLLSWIASVATAIEDAAFKVKDGLTNQGGESGVGVDMVATGITSSQVNQLAAYPDGAVTALGGQ